MARRVFFSFHHQQDSWRVGQVRNSWLLSKGETNAFLDAAAWETVKRKGDDAVKAWIDKELNRTGVTVILIGQYTSTRPYVKYEIQESYKRGNGLLGIYIHKIKNNGGSISRKGRNPLDDFEVEAPDPWLGFLGITSKQKLSDIFKTYDWTADNGRRYIAEWIEEAAKLAGR
ncbi:MAG TPA: TIR domain-containing protein [Desulfuromonadaceae bacterium]|nr:TIR domain-containing protein [Desulfuromonadaceae bacterium]